MAHVSTDLDTSAPPQAVIDALTDFSDRRLQLWPNIDRSYYKVHEVEETTAEVTEGSHGIWERNRYDWSVPGTVRIQVQDSNLFRAGSYWLYSVRPRPEGGSRVHLEVLRRPRNARGFLLSTVLSVFGRRVFSMFLRQTLQRLEREGPAAREPPHPA